MQMLKRLYVLKIGYKDDLYFKRTRKGAITIKINGILMILVGAFLLNFKITSAEEWVNAGLKFLGSFLTIQGTVMLAKKTKNLGRGNI